MLTVLNVEKRIPRGKWRGAFEKLSVNTLKVTRVNEQGISVDYINYICRNGRVDWRRISNKAKDGRINLIYTGKEEVPVDCGIVTFVPAALRQRLCGNMALEVLKLMERIPRQLKVGVYDPWGDFSDLAEYLLKYVPDVVVVTKNVGLYTEQAQRILEETGAVLGVKRNVSALSACGLIVSPDRVDEKFTPMTKAVVLTSREPCVSLGCRVYYRYDFRLPAEFESLRIKETDAEYFGGALYSLCGVYSLGSVVPFLCVSNTDSQTSLSLRNYLQECFGT